MPAKPRNPTLAVIQALDWAELGALFGSRTIARGERYHEQGHASNLRWTDDHRLLAEVQGTDVYETVVEVDGDGGLVTKCSCPVGAYCKHAVAAILGVLEACAVGESLPVGASPAPATSRRGARGRSPERVEPTREELGAWLREHGVAELVERVVRACELSEAVREDLCTAYRLARGMDSETVAAVEREIESLTSEDVWYDEWRGHGEIPDYGGLEARFEALRDAGMHDELLDLGVALFEGGTAQVEQAHDGGTTGMAICDCLGVAFASLGKSRRPLVERLLLAIDVMDRDEYGLVPDAVAAFVERRHRRAAWSEVADRLLAGLGAPGDLTEWSIRYRRRRRVDRIAWALDRAGRDAEATRLVRAEAPITRDWVRLVDRLVAAGDAGAAELAAREGLASLEDGERGEQNELRHRLREFAEQGGDLARAAAYRADAFFRSPSLETFRELLAAAASAGCERGVRRWMLRFLGSGRCPVEVGFRRRKGDPAAWPLPATGEAVAPSWTVARGLELLRDVAIAENEPAAVLRFHDRLHDAGGGRGTWLRDRVGGDDVRVADAVAASHPRRAIDLYLRMVDRLLTRADTKVYPQAASLLAKVGQLMGGKQASEWRALLAQLRERHARKRNFVRELDRLTRSPLERARARRASR